MRASLQRARAYVVVAATAAVAACFIVRERRLTPMDLQRPVAVSTPVRAHLRDGSVIVFASGATVTRDSITGADGRLYDATRVSRGAARGAALIDVVGAEVYTAGVNVPQTVGLNAMSIAAVYGLKYAFGSCPTVYSDSAGTSLLETESFSYSISPLTAKRDVDRLRVQPDASGIVRLEIRNEALETHYIDQMELLEVAHRADETVYPSAYGFPIAFRTADRPRGARDRLGRDVSGWIAAVDNVPFSSSDTTLARATHSDPSDWIDFAVAKPAQDSVALILRVRGSLLTTLLFYDRMLARPGAHSLDWMATDMSRILSVAGFGRWYGATMGLRIKVLQNGRYEQVGRLADFGPIAWRHVAVMIPAAGSDSVRVRLEFTADQWRIDQINIAGSARRIRPRVIPVARVRGSSNNELADLSALLAEADSRYVTTTPSQRFYAEFDTGRGSRHRTFLLAAHGYYVEWVRGEWLMNRTQGEPFDHTRLDMGELLRDWRTMKDSIERVFYNSKVPVS